MAVPGRAVHGGHVQASGAFHPMARLIILAVFRMSRSTEAGTASVCFVALIAATMSPDMS